MIKPIYIIGMPGAGKTTLAKEIAKEKLLQFTDTDQLICTLFETQYNAKLSIDEIFNQLNEYEFRNLERKSLHKTKNSTGIIACGGGLPCYFDNISWIKKNGVLLFLNTPIKEIASNMQLRPKKHPVLSNHNNQSPYESISQLLIKRLPFYKQANYEITFSNWRQLLNNINQN